VRVPPLALCGACRDALCAVAPEDARYGWFAGAVKARLFGGARAGAPGSAARPAVLQAPRRLRP